MWGQTTPRKMSKKLKTGITGDLLNNPAAMRFNINLRYPYWPEVNIEQGKRNMTPGYPISSDKAHIEPYVTIRSTVRVCHAGTWYVTLVKIDYRLTAPDESCILILEQFIEKVYHTQLLFDPAGIHNLKNEDGDSVWVKDHLQISELERISNKILNR